MENTVSPHPGNQTGTSQCGVEPAPTFPKMAEQAAKSSQPPTAVSAVKAKTLTTNITRAYKKNYTLYLPAVREGLLEPGTVRTRVEGSDDFEVTGELNFRGHLSGMAKLYSVLELEEGDTLSFQIVSPTEILVVPPRELVAQPAEKVSEISAGFESVFKKKKLNHIHFEAFRPENLLSWAPKAEVDVYMAFGILESYTEFKYCCGVNQEILNQLGATIAPKPDAIFIDRVTGEYLIVEFEAYSSKFGITHEPEDLLVCWEDDETDRSKVPKRVLALAEKACEAAIELLQLEEKEAE